MELGGPHPRRLGAARAASFTELLALAGHGDAESLRSLGAAARICVRRELARHAWLHGYADDVTQEVLFRAWSMLSRVGGLDSGRLSAWLHTVSHNVVANLARREAHIVTVDVPSLLATEFSDVPHGATTPARRTGARVLDELLTLGELLAVTDNDPVNCAMAQERAEMLMKALSDLKGRRRETLLRWIVRGETLTQIARDLHVSRWSTQRDVVAALRSLKESLTRLRS